jgi:phosphate transport system substrate-binding protein
MKRLRAALLTLLVLGGCTKEPGSTKITEGQLVVECDEAVFPVFEKVVAEFREQYKDAQLTLRSVEAREAIADFYNDSVRVIISARPFNKEEREMLNAAKIDVQESHVAQAAIALIAHKETPGERIRMTEADSIFGGERTRWGTGGRGAIIELVVGDINSSTNEVFRATLRGGRRFTLSASPTKSSRVIVDYVAKTRNTLGIVGVAWLKGYDERVKIMELGGPAYRPDTTHLPGQYYSPAQAYVFQGYYPLAAPVMIYSRAYARDLGLGFISFVVGPVGQKIITREGLVPVTMPVRIVQLTSERVN